MSSSSPSWLSIPGDRANVTLALDEFTPDHGDTRYHRQPEGEPAEQKGSCQGRLETHAGNVQQGDARPFERAETSGNHTGYLRDLREHEAGEDVSKRSMHSDRRKRR